MKMKFNITGLISRVGLIFIAIYALCTVNFSSCNNSITEAERIAGFYRATTFTEPGEHDGGVDILANGGILTARLSSNSGVEGRIVIPGNIGSNFAPVDVNYSGIFSVNEDTMHFENTETLLDLPVFIIYEHRLETPDMTGRMALFKIILEKQ
jgi:hypothetical protein